MAKTNVIHKVITLTGVAQAVGEVFGLPTAAVRITTLQPGEANANPVYVGGKGVTSTDYGVRLPASAAGVPSAPWDPSGGDDGTLDMGDVYVVGTLGEKLHVFAVIYQ